ncbi:hypothetical protein [Halopiger djelfimassiliensis]|uniref:hypothetical protein n=1 Tax=Halopiger djelfimassiliensis TaxID=1293047 RepID=UPI00067817B6|nr:hypothetical protein [Halopiger djelfimassiliensis]
MSESDATTRQYTRATRLVLALRTLAFALLVVGFGGWLLEDGAVALESPFTVAFFVGTGCAFASIYLGVVLADGGSDR